MERSVAPIVQCSRRARTAQFEKGRIGAGPLARGRDGTMMDSRIPILIADGDADSRLIFGQYLRYVGFEVIEAADAENALELARRHLPRAIVCDLLPPTSRGVAFLDALRADASTRAIPVILVTAWLLTPHWDGVESTSRVLLKPCPPADLVRELTAVLDAR